MTHSGKRPAREKKLSQRIRIFCRRHFFNKHAAEGSITIFLLIIMLPMLIFSCSVIDICKIFMARNSTDGALELAMNSRLASYDDILKDMYGIMASSADEDELAKKLTSYYKMTLESSTGSVLSSDDEKYVENFFADLFGTDTSNLDGAVKDTNGLLNLYENDKTKFSVTPIVTSSASNPKVMHKQIVEYMKYRGPVYLATGALDKIMAFSDVSNQAKAAEAQITYEKQLNDAGNTFKEVYNELTAFLNDSINFEKSQQFKGFYSSDYSGIVPPKSFRDCVSTSIPAAYVCSFFGTAIDEYGILNILSDAEDAFASEEDLSHNISDAADNLNDMMSELEGIESDANDAAELFGDYEEARSFIRNSGTKPADLLNNRFGALFENVSKVGNDDVILLLAAYNEARQYSNYLEKEYEKEQKKKDSESKENALEALEEKMGEVDTAINNAESTINSIKSAAKAIKDFMEQQYFLANETFKPGANDLNTAYEMIKKQLERLDFLLGSDGISKAVSDLKLAGERAGDFKDAIDGVNTKSEKANMTGVYNSGAAKVQAITLDDAAQKELTGYLEGLRSVYTAAKNTIESIQYLKDTGIENSIVKNNAVQTDVTVFMDKFCDGHKGESINAWYIYSSYNDYKYYSYTSNACTNIGAWDSQNENIAKNDFYKTIVKYGKEKKEASQEAKNKAEDTKDKIDNLGKKAGEANDPKKAAADESQNDNSDDNPGVWFVPKRYPTYSGYINDLHTAYNTDKNGDDNLKILDDTSFSYEKSKEQEENEKNSADDIGSTSFGDDISKGAGDLLRSIGDFFTNLLTATRDKLYIAEYLTENFPCVTTLQEDESAQMISGELFYSSGKANVVCAHSSLEYILYGNVQGGEAEAALSVAKASAVVFGVRFALNLIYALTSASLALQIEPMVAALEFIPFAAPLVRTVILIGLALGESAIDVGLLLANQEVALFKSDATWICSPSGIVTAGADALVDVAVDKGTQLIDKATDAIQSKLVEKEQELATALKDGSSNVKDKVDEYAEEMLKEIQAEIENNVWTPIITLIRSYVDDFDPNTTSLLTANIIKDELDKVLDSAEEHLGLNGSSTSDDFVKEIEKEIFDFIRANESAIVNTIQSNIKVFYDTAKDGMVNGIDSLDKKVKERLSSVEAKIQSYFTDATGKLNEKVHEVIDDTVNELKKNTIKATDDVASKLKSGINEKLRGMKSNAKNRDYSKESSSDGLLSDKKDTKKDVDKTFKVSYKDYLYVFTVLGLIINEDNMLMRAGQLMSANIEYKAFGSTRSDRPGNAYNSDVSYDLNKAYTLFKGEAGSRTRTMFFGTTWNKQDQQWVRPASNVYSYTATTYVGY